MKRIIIESFTKENKNFLYDQSEDDTDVGLRYIVTNFIENYSNIVSGT